MGYEHAPPLQYVDDQGRPYGAAFELLNEASRRSGIDLEWVHAPEGVDAIASGKVDLWPIAHELPERKHLYFTTPYGQVTFWLISLDQSRILDPGSLTNERVGFAGSLSRLLVERQLSHAKLVQYPGAKGMVQAVCDGQIRAGVILESPTHASMFTRPENCTLRVSPLKSGKLWSSIAARRSPEAIAAADRLRGEISNLVEDGTFSTISMKWFRHATSEAAVIERLSVAHNEARFRNVLLVFFAAAAGLLAWLAWRLHAARRAAEQATAAKSQFLANMSHEIRTPMNAIVALTEMTLANGCTARQKESLGMVMASAEALLAIVNDILDLSKIEAGKLALSPAPFSLSGCLDGVVRTLMPQAEKKGLRLSAHLDAGEADHVVADEGRLRQILVNLAGNAVKFTEQGEIRLELRLAMTGSHTARLHGSVTDTGIGIAPDKQKSIFEAFMQADNSISRRFGGTGLGLAITARLVESMGGSIRLHSRPGEGSTFTFDIPVELPAEEVSASDPVSAAPEPAPRTLRVLVAEDNPINQQIVVTLLAGRGHTIKVVGNGKLAVEEAASGQYDVILMDVQMPEVDGLEATRAIREREKRLGAPRIPIVALTAHAMAGDRERCLEAGMDTYLSKPFKARELHNMLAAL